MQVKNQRYAGEIGRPRSAQNTEHAGGAAAGRRIRAEAAGRGAAGEGTQGMEAGLYDISGASGHSQGGGCCRRFMRNVTIICTGAEFLQRLSSQSFVKIV